MHDAIIEESGEYVSARGWLQPVVLVSVSHGVKV